MRCPFLPATPSSVGLDTTQTSSLSIAARPFRLSCAPVPDRGGNSKTDARVRVMSCRSVRPPTTARSQPRHSHTIEDATRVTSSTTRVRDGELAASPHSQNE